MCTNNQKMVRSGQKAYKVCKLRFGKIHSIYENYLWTIGKNEASNETSMPCDSLQIGFHCFANKKDAIDFVNRSRKNLAHYNRWSHIYRKFMSGRIVVIAVTLKSNGNRCKEVNNLRVRQGTNCISNPATDFSPCYVGPIAIWDGKYEIIK